MVTPRAASATDENVARKRAAPRGTALSGSEAADESALRELEALARLGAAVLLALDHAAVAGEEAGGLDRAAQQRLELAQSLADAVLDRPGLARQSAAGDRADNVVLINAVGDLERLGDDQAQRRPREEHFLIP